MTDPGQAPRLSRTRVLSFATRPLCSSSVRRREDGGSEWTQLQGHAAGRGGLESGAHSFWARGVRDPPKTTVLQQTHCPKKLTSDAFKMLSLGFSGVNFSILPTGRLDPKRGTNVVTRSPRNRARLRVHRRRDRRDSKTGRKQVRTSGESGSSPEPAHILSHRFIFRFQRLVNRTHLQGCREATTLAPVLSPSGPPGFAHHFSP